MVRWFIQALARYTTIDEFIKAAQNYLKSTDNDQIIAFYDKINLANDRFGGADIVFDQDGILVIEVKSFPTNQLLNGHTTLY
jgi:superfamily I DNA/RNA helicase